MTHDQTQSRLRLLPRGIEENHFKAVPEGWLVTVKRPFGSDWNHIVSDAQKPMIATRVRLAIGARYSLLVCWLLIAILDMSPGHRETSFASFALLFAINACDYLSTRSVLRDAPLTPDTVTFRDQMRSRADAMSVSALVTLTVICTIAAVGLIAAGLILFEPASIDKVPAVIRTFAFIVVFALWIGAGIYWLRLLAIKLQAPRRDP
jgi:sterol desaturase/sphingolipid hydroxylase (fatty acid hydroxylase superfamily)